MLIDSGVMGISNAFYGTKLFFNADIPEVTDYVERWLIDFIYLDIHCLQFHFYIKSLLTCRMNAANVELTQVLSQVSGPPMLSIADDL
jgi:hypothetical protein